MNKNIFVSILILTYFSNFSLTKEKRNFKKEKKTFEKLGKRMKKYFPQEVRKLRALDKVSFIVGIIVGVILYPVFYFLYLGSDNKQKIFNIVVREYEIQEDNQKLGKELLYFHQRLKHVQNEVEQEEYHLKDQAEKINTLVQELEGQFLSKQSNLQQAVDKAMNSQKAKFENQIILTKNQLLKING